MIMAKAFTLKTPQQALQELVLRIKRLRLERGWSQAELAARDNVRLATYQLFERRGQLP